jgi:hypothetical protein
LWPELPPYLAAATIYDIVIVALFVIMVPALIMLAVREARDLSREDPPPERSSDVVGLQAEVAGSGR